MGAHNIGRASALPSPVLLESAIRHLSRSELADLCEHLIDRLDWMDPDPDLEPNGDELDGTMGEDEFCTHSVPGRLQGAGCPLADGIEESDEDYCLASDDRGSSGPAAFFAGYSPHKAFEFDEDCERWSQPVHLS
ncbi:hypothetical protein GRI38_04265 [Altererythrobacter aurantiacus]|uniref:Uncharacterized protein n=1 Tax=Parapontixanthobacter aurantiacus TaxID=1463599 RepID=A0A844ZDZ6_9SPHN|nr:hypothetical protein [Parapontixanthobacter aurantiacus]MXO85237.1 hypothetical protein [Parapontixanthobacter aurantiacus]